jgi:asparagine synthase (glutamine-hydrolysing)
MCGIAGIINRRQGTGPSSPAPVSEEILKAMTTALAHRGPDGKGHLLRDGVGLGHRRLSIIDPALGQQPMCNEDGTVWVTYNGEIYNYQNLRQQLEMLGHRFKTQCDTEVLVHGYEQWGKAIVERCRGMFAFCVVDFAKRKGMLARDHFGIKPLYWRATNGPAARLIFASELIAIKTAAALLGDQLTGNLFAIELFFRYQYIPAPATIYNGVYKLGPAQRIEFDLDGDIAEPERYWQIQFAPDTKTSERQWEERLAEALRDSVRAHLRSDVPFGVLLSGGIDSSLVALNMSRLLDRPVKAFSIGFTQNQHSEIPFAKTVASQCGIELETQEIGDDFWAELPHLVQHYGEPFGDSSAVPTWAVSRLARQSVPMVLSGDGGDEGFGGYDSYLGWMHPNILAPLRRLRKFKSATELRSLAWAIARRGWKSPAAVSLEWIRLIQYSTWSFRHALWKTEYHRLIAKADPLFSEAHLQAPRTDALAYAQYMDYQTYLPCDILTKVDVASMFHGLEVRTPLIDLGVVEIARQLPMTARVRHGREANRFGGWEGKLLPKRLLERDFSRSLVRRPKQGFALPKHIWFLRGQNGRRMLEEIVLPANSPLNQFFNATTIQQTVASHSMQDDRSNILWLLLILGIWLDQNRDIQFTAGAA